MMASAVTLVFGYYAFRATLIVPGFREMYSGFDDEALRSSAMTMLVLNHSGAIGAMVVATVLITIAAIWSSHRLAGVISAGGIVMLGIGTHFLVNAATAPFVEMIRAMGAQ